MKAWEVLRRGGKPSEPIRPRADADQALVQRVTFSKPVEGFDGFEWKVRGDHEWVPERTAPALRRAVGEVRLTIGTNLWARRAGSSTVFVLRPVEYVPAVVIPPVPSSATPGAAALWRAIFESLPIVERRIGRPVRFVFMGLYNPRGINGAPYCTRPSQHGMPGCGKGNAIDGRLVSDRFPTIDKVATDDLVTVLRNHHPEVASELLWNVPGHTFHFHGTAVPKLFGKPCGCVILSTRGPGWISPEPAPP